MSYNSTQYEDGTDEVETKVVRLVGNGLHQTVMFNKLVGEEGSPAGHVGFRGDYIFVHVIGPDQVEGGYDAYRFCKAGATPFVEDSFADFVYDVMSGQVDWENLENGTRINTEEL
jgi:hypothetical protein